MSQSKTPEMVEPHVSIDRMASVQQNREMNHENPKRDETHVKQPATWNSTLFLPAYF